MLYYKHGGDIMNAEHIEVDKLYEDLKIKNSDTLRTFINCGNMNRKLNSDFSAVFGKKGCINLSSSTGNLKM